MFNFGLFSTHIPYIVIAAVYLLYCGSSVLNKLEPKEVEQLQDWEIRITPLTSNVDLNAIRYQDVLNKDCKADSCIKKWMLVPLRFLPCRVYIPDIIYSNNYSGLPHYSRPPPTFC